MLHLATDADTGHIAASVLTDRDADDGSQVGPLLDRTDGSVASSTGDGAYDWDDVYAEVMARHPDAAVVVPPRLGAVLSEAAEMAATPRSSCSLVPSVCQEARRAIGRSGMGVAPSRSNAGVPQRGLHEVNRRTSIKAVTGVRVAQPVG